MREAFQSSVWQRWVLALKVLVFTFLRQQQSLDMVFTFPHLGQKWIQLLQHSECRCLGISHLLKSLTGFGRQTKKMVFQVAVDIASLITKTEIKTDIADGYELAFSLRCSGSCSFRSLPHLLRRISYALFISMTFGFVPIFVRRKCILMY